MVTVEARGAGEPLALLHGVGANRGIWDHVAPSLAKQRRVLTADLPGFGESAPVGRDFALNEVALAVADALVEQAGPAFDLVGNSVGGAIALVLARERPSAVRRLVLVAPAGFSPRPELVCGAAGLLAGSYLTARRLLGTPLAGVAPARRALLWGTVAAPQRMAESDARAMLQASRGSASVGAAIASVLRADLRPDLERLEAPLGFIWGERDRIVPVGTLAALRALRPDAVVETIPDTAHVPQIERPGMFVAALERVLERL